MTQMLLGIAPEWVPTFENFVAGRNVEVLAAVKSALGAAQGERAIYVWGDSGGGKSHLLKAATGVAELNGLSVSYARGQVPAEAQVVAIDDVDRLDGAAQVELFALYNQMRESKGLLLMSGPQSPTLLRLRDDLRTRLCWGLVYQLHALNDGEKADALRQHAQARGFELPNEVVAYLLRHGRRDLPSLLCTLDALDERCLQLKRGASVPILKEVIVE